METSRELSPSPVTEVPSILDNGGEVLYLGKELGLDLWIKPETSQRQSILIRSTTPDGVTRSSFMHVDGHVEQIPVFDNQDPLVLQEKNDAMRREFTWSPEKFKRKNSRGRLVLNATSLLVALFILGSLFTGIVQMRVVLTGSMVPAINPGDLLIAVSKDYVEPKIGKVVLYSARDLQGKAVTVWSHRIIAGDKSAGFTIKGDANAEPDIGLIPLRDIQTVMVLRVPFIGHIFNIYSMALIISGLFLLSFTTRRRKG
jgi:signal peptidase I